MSLLLSQLSATTVTVTFSESSVVVPHRRGLIYRSIFAPGLNPVSVSGALSEAGSTSAAFVGAATGAGVFATAGATAAAFVGAGIGAGVFAAAGSTTAAFVGEVPAVPAVVTFTESQAIVPSRRALIYRSVFAPGLSPSISAGAFSAAGSTSPSFVSNAIVQVFLSDVPQLPPLRRRRIDQYQTIFSPPLFVPITISGTFSSTGSTSVAFIESALFAGALAVSGATNAAFVGASTAEGVFAAAGSTTAALVSNAIVTVFFAEAKAEGTALRRRRLAPYQTLFEPPLFVPITRQGSLSVSGSTAAAFTGASIASGVLAVSGATLPAFAGAATGAGVLSITGSTTALFVGPNFQAGALSGSGSTTVDAVGRTIVAAAFSIAGSTTIAAVGVQLKTVAAVMAAVGASDINFSTTPIRHKTGRRTRVRAATFNRPDTVFPRRPAQTFASRRPQRG